MGKQPPTARESVSQCRSGCQSCASLCARSASAESMPITRASSSSSMLLFRVNDLDDGTTKLHNGSALRDESFQKRIDLTMNGAELRLRSAPRSELEQRIEALGPWFHNMNLAGIWTAPDHFLGDYP